MTCGLFSLALRRRNHHRLLEAELQESFAWDFHLLAAGEHLHGSPGAGADACANRRALSASGDCPNDRSQSRTTADFLRGVLAAPFALQRVVAAHHLIVLTLDHHAG